MHVFGTVLLFYGCSGSNESVDTTLSSPRADMSFSQDFIAEQVADASAESEANLGNLHNNRVFAVPGVLELSGVKLLQDVGAVEFVKTYIANFPTSAQFLTFWEVARIRTAMDYLHDGEDVSGTVLADFEFGVLRTAKRAGSSLPQIDGSQVLHDAFFEAMEECGRSSAWPGVELFVMHQGVAGEMPDVMIEPTFGLSYLEFVELRHGCARYAATYPTLDPFLRDELLAPQRAHYADAILDWIDNSLPAVEIPIRYRDEIDELRVHGW